LGAQELLQLFQEAAQLNGFSIEQILAAGVSEGIRTPEAKRGNSPELSPLIGLEALFSDEEVDPPRAAAVTEIGSLPSPVQTSPAATDGENEGSDSEEDTALEIPKLGGVPRSLLAASRAPAAPAPKPSQDDKQRAGGRAEASPKPERTQAQPKMESAAQAAAVRQGSGGGSSGDAAPPSAEGQSDAEVGKSAAAEKLAVSTVANSVTNPREYRQFMKVIQQRHLPEGVEAALKAKGKQTLFQEFLAADCNITAVVARMKKEVEKASTAAEGAASREPPLALGQSVRRSANLALLAQSSQSDRTTCRGQHMHMRQGLSGTGSVTAAAQPPCGYRPDGPRRTGPQSQGELWARQHARECLARPAGPGAPPGGRLAQGARHRPAAVRGRRREGRAGRSQEDSTEPLQARSGVPR
jgi:hypothetical protein